MRGLVSKLVLLCIFLCAHTRKELPKDRGGDESGKQQQKNCRNQICKAHLGTCRWPADPCCATPWVVRRAMTAVPDFASLLRCLCVRFVLSTARGHPSCTGRPNPSLLACSTGLFWAPHPRVACQLMRLQLGCSSRCVGRTGWVGPRVRLPSMESLQLQDTHTHSTVID